MSAISASPYRKWFLVALCLQVITAWFSVGYNYPDEHFQILEYCNYKMGHTPLSALPWEFAEQCRPAIQPLIAYCLFRPMDMMGIFNPFIGAFILRLLTGILAWWVTCRILLLLLPQFTSEKSKKLYLGFSLFLWFIPYLGVRFSAENFAGLLFFLALSLLLQLQDPATNKRLLRFSITGLLLGFSLMVRPQMAFAFIGLGSWMLFVQKWNWRAWITMIIFAVIAAGLCIAADHWLYNTWVFTPFNYYKINIIQHKAADFGVSPWWYYFVSFFQSAAPPISVVLLILFFLGLYRKSTHVFSIVIITFVAGHCAIGHKEMRFLFPMVPAFIFLCCAGLDFLLQKFKVKPWHQWIWKPLLTMNFVLLGIKMFTPAQEIVKYYGFLYRYINKHNTPLVALDDGPYIEDGLENNFYKPHNFKLEMVRPDTAKQFLSKINKPVLFFNSSLQLPNEFSSNKTELLYCYFPDWVLQNNTNNWQDRSRIWAIFKIYAPNEKD